MPRNGIENSSSLRARILPILVGSLLLLQAISYCLEPHTFRAYIVLVVSLVVMLWAWIGLMLKRPRAWNLLFTGFLGLLFMYIGGALPMPCFGLPKTLHQLGALLFMISWLFIPFLILVAYRPSVWERWQA